MYDGEFDNNLRNGNGSQFVHGKIYYIGNFVDGNKVGYGVAVYSEDLSQHYVGQWKDNLVEGQGKMVTPTYTYEGQWKDNKMHGNGLLVSRIGEGDMRSVWPDLAIFWTLGNFLKPLATINLPKSPNILGQFL